MAKPDGRKQRVKSRLTGSQRRRAPTVDAAAQIAKWARLEETLNKKKKQGRQMNLHPSEALRKARKAAKHGDTRERNILVDWESSQVVERKKKVPSAEQPTKPPTIKQLARQALQAELAHRDDGQ